MTEKRKNLLFIAVILALAAVLWLAAHHGGTGRGWKTAASPL